MLVIVAADRPAHLARVSLAALPDDDVAAEVRSLTAQGRLGEAIALADAAIADGQTGDALTRVREDAAKQQASWLRSAKEIGWGAFTGRGETIEGLIGAVGADFFVVGDIRDLVIQGTAAASRNDPDEVVAALSLFGLTTTLAPQIDWAPSILKVARKAGSLTESFARTLGKWIKNMETAKVVHVCEDVAAVGKAVPPGTILRTLRGVESAEDLAKVARFAEREGQKSMRFLHAAGPDAVQAVKLVEEAGESGAKVAGRAARKGSRGIAFLRSPAAKALLKPHPILGLLKGLWKGTIPELVERAIERLAPQGWWFIPIVALWVLVEVWVMWRRLYSASA